MTLNQYEARIGEIANSNLTNDEKANALDLLATEIDGCLWQPQARERARDIAAAARAAMLCTPTLAGLDSLAARGAITRR